MTKTVVVTGAAGGMGACTCRKLSDEGYCVVGLDIKEPGDTEGIFFIKTDLTDAESVGKAADTVREKFGKVYAVVNLAGVYDLNSLVEMPEEDFVRLFNVNLFGTYRVNKAFIPLMEKGSRFVITSSELAPLDPLPFTGIYGVVKTAAEKYAYSLRMEVQLLGMDVSVLRPGAVDTELLGVSVNKINSFVENTKYYPCNAENFRKITESVESKKVPAVKIAEKVYKIVSAKRPGYVYSINRNPLLLLLNALPKHMQNAVIRGILKQKKTKSQEDNNAV